MDDASYSGTQMNDALMTLAPDASLAETHLIVPFMTTFALKTITEKTPKVIIHPYQKMALITEEIPDKETVSTIDTMYFPVLNEGDSKSHTMTIFDHKIADHLSTLDEVYRYGVIRNSEGKFDDSNVQWDQNIFSTRFVPTTYPCYKSVQTK